MKNIFKKFAPIVLALAMVFALAGVVACGGKSSAYSYTVTVLNPDGTPYAGAKVQLCEIVDESGTPGNCYDSVPANENGVAVVEFDSVISSDYMEVHLQGLPICLNYTSAKIHNGESATIRTRLKSGSELSLPKSGDGTGSYLNDEPSKIDNSSFNPYVVEEGAYTFRFTSEGQKIYYEFRTDYAGIYKVYSYGSVDAKISMLTGTKMTGINHSSDAEFNSDDISATDKNFSLEFTVDSGALKMGNEADLSSMYFEVSLKDAQAVNADSLICFEFVDDLPEDTTDNQDVLPQETLSDYPAGVGNLVNVALDGTVTPVYNATDGYYHLNSADGAVLVATLGTDSQLNTNHQSNNVHVPRGYDVSLSIMCREFGQSFTVIDGNVRKNYYPLVAAYVEKSNSNGVYGVTEELKGLLDVMINQILDKDWVLDAANNPNNILSEVAGGKLPEGKEWLWACAYYDGEEVEQGTTADYPFDLYATTADAEEGSNQNEITVPEGGKVYYSYYAKGPVTLTLTSDSQNVKLGWYSKNAGIAQMETAESGDSGFNATLTLNNQMTEYILEFSSKDGQAATYTITAISEQLEAAEGSADNPIEITTLGEQTGELIEGDCHFIYTVTEQCEIHFKAGANTQILDITYEVGDVPVSKSLEQWEAMFTDGFKFEVGTKIKITVLAADMAQEGTVSFEISKTAFSD